MKKTSILDLDRYEIKDGIIGKRVMYGHVNLLKHVKWISDYCFYRDGINQKITLNDGLEKIGAFAFTGGFSGDTIRLPSTLKEIGKGAFNECPNLKYMRVPAGVKRISEMCFNFCYELEWVDVQEGVEEIGDYAFTFCKKLRYIKLPRSINKIGFCILWGTYKYVKLLYAGSEKEFEKIEWKEKEKFKDRVLFNDSSDLEWEGEGIERIKESTGFVHNWTDRKDLLCDSGGIYRESRPKYVTIPEGVKEIGECCFDGEIIIGVDLPNSLESIGKFGFYGYKGREIILPKELKLIDNSAFAESKLKEIEIPSSVKKICGSAFSGSKNLKKVTLNEGIETIGVFAFSRCDSLDSITLPESVIDVQLGAFNKCIKLKEIIVKGQNKQNLKGYLKSRYEKIKII